MIDTKRIRERYERIMPNPNPYHDGAEYEYTYHAIMKLCDELDAEREKNRWIPVSERLPEDERYRLVSATYPGLGKVMYIMFYHIYNELWYDKDGYSSRDVTITHWKETPEHPEEQDD